MNKPMMAASVVVLLVGCGIDYEEDGWGPAVRKTIADLRESLPAGLRGAVEEAEAGADPAPADGEDTAPADTATGGNADPAPADGEDTARTVESCEKAMDEKTKALIAGQQAMLEATRAAGLDLARWGERLAAAKSGAVGPSVMTAGERIDSGVSGLATSTRIMLVVGVVSGIEAGWELAQLPECSPELFDPAQWRGKEN